MITYRKASTEVFFLKDFETFYDHEVILAGTEESTS